jgi:hypothetical protein
MIILNPKNNPSINAMFRHFTYETFYFNEFSDDSDETEKTEEIYDDFNFTNNNWKSIYNTLTINFYYYQKKDIAKSIYSYFKNHLYLPSIRKDNKYLESKNSSLHQLFYYDLHINNKITYNHYDKYINDNNLNTKDTQDKDKDFILKKSLPFEDELINFKEILQNVKNDINLINILKIIIDYDYEKMDLMFVNQKNSKDMINSLNIKNSQIFNFIFYLNHTIILFVKFIYKYNIIYDNNNKINYNKLLVEYVNKYNDFVNFSLLINEHFRNINIIINYLAKFILTDYKINEDNNSYNYFSIYQLCNIIIKKEIYTKIKNKLKAIFEFECNEYLIDLFEKPNDEKNNDINSNESKTKEDSNSFEDYEDNYEYEDEDYISEENNEKSHKENIENFMNCMTDFSINEFNCKLINHSGIKMNDDYEMYENILVKCFINKIDKYLINEEKSFEEIFLVIKDVISIKNEDINAISGCEGNGLNLIKRVKNNIFQNIMNYLKKFIINKIKEDILNNIQCNEKNKNKNKKVIVNKNIFLSNEEKNKISEEQKIIIIELYNSEINKIKNDIISIKNDEQFMSNIEINKIEEIIDSYFDDSNGYLSYYYPAILKEILFYNFIENAYYSKMNSIIINLLNKSKNKKEEYSIFLN